MNASNKKYFYRKLIEVWVISIILLERKFVKVFNKYYLRFIIIVEIYYHRDYILLFKNSIDISYIFINI